MTEQVQGTDPYVAEVNRYYRRNFVAALIDNSMFYFIFLGLSPYTVLPLYLHKLTDSRLLIGLIPATYVITYAAPQLLIARFLLGKRRKKRYLVASALVQRVGIAALLGLTLLQNQLANIVVIALFFASYALQNLASGCYVPVWMDFLGRAIPRQRGKLFGISNLLGGLLSIAGGALLKYFLQSLAYPKAYTAILASSLLASLVSLAAILCWHEPVSTSIEANPSAAIRSASPLQHDASFRRYLLWRSLITGVEMALPFYSLHALERLSLSDAQVGVFSVLLSLSETVVNPIWGWLGDRHGYLITVILSSMVGSAGALLAANAHSLLLFYLVFVCAGVMLSGLQFANINIIYDFSGRDDVPIYAALSNLILSPLSSMAPVLGGFVANHWSYVACFWIAGVLGSGASLGMALLVPDPRRHRHSQPVC